MGKMPAFVTFIVYLILQNGQNGWWRHTSTIFPATCSQNYQWQDYVTTTKSMVLRSYMKLWVKYLWLTSESWDCSFLHTVILENVRGWPWPVALGTVQKVHTGWGAGYFLVVVVRNFTQKFWRGSEILHKKSGGDENFAQKLLGQIFVQKFLGVKDLYFG